MSITATSGPVTLLDFSDRLASTPLAPVGGAGRWIVDATGLASLTMVVMLRALGAAPANVQLRIAQDTQPSPSPTTQTASHLTSISVPSRFGESTNAIYRAGWRIPVVAPWVELAATGPTGGVTVERIWITGSTDRVDRLRAIRVPYGGSNDQDWIARQPFSSVGAINQLIAEQRWWTGPVTITGQQDGSALQLLALDLTGERLFRWTPPFNPGGQTSWWQPPQATWWLLGGPVANVNIAITAAEQ